jgi:hypothetical protein
MSVQVKMTPTDNTEPFMLIPLQNGMFAKVSPEDWPEISSFTWKAILRHGNYYAVREIKRGLSTYEIKMHRQILKTPKGQLGHHHNGDGLDNRRSNLSNVFRSEHSQIHGRSVA